MNHPFSSVSRLIDTIHGRINKSSNPFINNSSNKDYVGSKPKGIIISLVLFLLGSDIQQRKPFV